MFLRILNPVHQQFTPPKAPDYSAFRSSSALKMHSNLPRQYSVKKRETEKKKQVATPQNLPEPDLDKDTMWHWVENENDEKEWVIL